MRANAASATKSAIVRSIAPVALLLSLSASASAQAPLPPLPPDGSRQSQPQPMPPPLPPQQPYSQQPYPQQPYAQPYGQSPPPPGYGAPYGQPAQPNYHVRPEQPPPPPPIEYNPPPEPAHAPKFSLWAGGRLGVLGYGGNFYQNEFQDGETTGNFIRTGLSLGIDVGARLGKRYLPYLFLEHGFAAAGHRFVGGDATAASDLYGGGFRYIAGDVDSVGFLTDISVGLRTITVKNNGDTYKMSSIEIFRLGLGAEIRISTLFSISPMATLSGGAMSDTEGHVAYSQEGSHDGLAHPAYQDGKQIGNQRGYIVLGLGCGGHFDIFGK